MATVLSKDNRRFFKLSDQTPPDIPIKPEDTIVVAQVSDRLDLLAQEYYGDVYMYRAIVLANENLGKGSLYIEPGTYVRIPSITREEFEEIITQYNFEK